MCEANLTTSKDYYSSQMFLTTDICQVPDYTARQILY